MESKRLGRTLPAVINGLSAAQAQSQGFIEVASDADTASVANSESLFVGESDNESVSSRSRSGSPENIQSVNGHASQLNPASTPFDPNPTTTAPPRPNPFQAPTTFGKPRGAQIQTKSTPVFDFNSKSTNQAAHNAFQSKEPPKFQFFPPSNGTKAEDSKGIAGDFGSKDVSKASPFLSQFAPKTEQNSTGAALSPFAPPMDKTTFGQPSTTFPTATNLEQTKTVAEKSPNSSEASAPSKPNSVFDQPATSAAPHVFSFGTSPLFGSAETGSKPHASKAQPQALEGKEPSIPAPQQKDVAIEPPKPTTSSTPKSTPFSLFPPSNPLTKKTNLPQAAPLEFPNSNHTLLAASASQFNARSPQPSLIFPSSTTPAFQPPPSSPSAKPFEATQRPTGILGPATFNSRAFSDSPGVNRSGSQPGQEQSTFAPSQLDPTSIALDKLSKLILLEDNGIIQHFIEFTIGPIIKASIAQFDDESSWKEASQSPPSGLRCGEPMLIGNRGMSCSLVGQEVL